ncbi:MAG: carbonic anhydrase [Pirellulales bacterium]|nr:carbonic anhydrase [Pirellulales bacterium]
MQKLITGLHQFQQNVFGEHRDLFERLAAGQQPEALFITCSDSRINPNLITQTEPGELFILRNAGNLIPPYGAPGGGEAATIEFAIKGLGIRDIIVCGHSHCGAMKALIQPELLTEMPTLTEWLRHAEATRQIVREKYADRTGRAKLMTTIEENVLVQLENLRTHPAVAARLAQGTLNLHGWVYKLETGEVFYYDSESGQFLPLGAEGVTEPQNASSLAI